jgi:Tfp pilus assembly protein PilV
MNLHRKGSIRSGFAIVEAIAALVIVGAGLVGTAQVLIICARQRLSSDQLLSAQFEAANVMEHIAAMRYDQLTPSNLAQLKLSAESQSTLPGGQLRVTMADDMPSEQARPEKVEDQTANKPAVAQNDVPKDGEKGSDAAPTAKNSATAQSKRIRIEVRWPAETPASPDAAQSREGSTNLPDHVVSLTAWKYAPAEESKP